MTRTACCVGLSVGWLGLDGPTLFFIHARRQRMERERERDWGGYLVILLFIVVGRMGVAQSPEGREEREELGKGGFGWMDDVLDCDAVNGAI